MAGASRAKRTTRARRDYGIVKPRCELTYTTDFVGGHVVVVVPPFPAPFGRVRQKRRISAIKHDEIYIRAQVTA